VGVVVIGLVIVGIAGAVFLAWIMRGPLHSEKAVFPLRNRPALGILIPLLVILSLATLVTMFVRWIANESEEQLARERALVRINQRLSHPRPHK
jgi:hypothetical protein